MIDYISFNKTEGNNLFKSPTAENLQNYFKSLENSKLSKSEQILLLEQITVDFVETNVLNIYSNVRNILNKRRKPIDKDALNKMIHDLVKNIVENIVLTSNYKEKFLNFNYANAFQSLYYFVSLVLYRCKNKIIAPVSNSIK